MPYIGKDFTPTDTGAIETYTFDFSNDLGANETIEAASFTCATIDGIDIDPQAHVQGQAQVSGNLASQQIEGLVGGALYRLQCAVTTSLGNVLILYSHVRCKDPQ